MHVSSTAFLGKGGKRFVFYSIVYPDIDSSFVFFSCPLMFLPWVETGGVQKRILMFILTVRECNVIVV